MITFNHYFKEVRMTDRYAYQGPLDFSGWTPDGGEASGWTPDEGEAAGVMPDAETMERWAEEEARNPTPPSEDDLLKEALRQQNFEDRFVVPDPSDEYTDDQLWEMMPESIRGTASE